jgi:hypothetical protein
MSAGHAGPERAPQAGGKPRSTARDKSSTGIALMIPRRWRASCRSCAPAIRVALNHERLLVSNVVPALLRRRLGGSWSALGPRNIVPHLRPRRLSPSWGRTSMTHETCRAPRPTFSRTSNSTAEATCSRGASSTGAEARSALVDDSVGCVGVGPECILDRALYRAAPDAALAGGYLPRRGRICGRAAR